MLAFIIWILCAVLFLGIAVICMVSKKPVGFWANVKPPKIDDVKAFNHAVGKLWIGYAIVFAILGLPLLQPDSALIMLSVVGVMLECIVLVILYLRIEQKYRNK